MKHIWKTGTLSSARLLAVRYFVSYSQKAVGTNYTLKKARVSWLAQSVTCTVDRWCRLGSSPGCMPCCSTWNIESSRSRSSPDTRHSSQVFQNYHSVQKECWKEQQDVQSCIALSCGDRATRKIVCSLILVPLLLVELISGWIFHRDRVLLILRSSVMFPF